MDQLKEIHDPDYPEASVCVKEEPPSLTEDEKIRKIKSIIHREFSNELEAREEEVRLIDQRLLSSRRLLHRLRYSLVSSFYCDQKLQLTPAHIHDEIALQRDPKAQAEISSLIRDGQRHIHPSLRKLLGTQEVDMNEIFRSRGPRNKTRKNYSAMLQKRNYTIPADSASLRPPTTPPPEPPPRRVPRALKPKVTNVLTLESSRNQAKHRYRFIIGNTSKYVPAASRLDRSTHKWLLYIRGPLATPDPSPLLTGVSVTLHHSYAPHHRVNLHKHPFHISRRGWGEFPARIELHFTLPEHNRPITLEHNLKLDRHYTGMQTLGSETILDVWLYSTTEMLQCEFKEDENTLTDAPTDQQTPHNKQTETVKTFNKPTETVITFNKPTETVTTVNKPTETALAVKKPTETVMAVKKPTETVTTVNKPTEKFITVKKLSDMVKTNTKPAETIKTNIRSTETVTRVKKSTEDINVNNKQATITNIPINVPIKEEPIKEEVIDYLSDQGDSWMDFFKTPTELDVDEMFLKPNKQLETNMINQEIKREIENMETDFEEKIDEEIQKSDQIESQSDKDIQNEFSEDNILKVPNEILNQPASVKKRIVKYIDPTTGKIYYLEMDRELDLTKVQEIIINNTATKISPIKSNGLKNVRKKKGMSLLKPEVKNQVALLKPDVKGDMKPVVTANDYRQSFPHLENDHCYLGCSKIWPEEVKKENLYDSLVSVMSRFSDVRSAVNYLVRHIPVTRDGSSEAMPARRYWTLEPTIRRNMEWSRAKLINKLLHHYKGPASNIWRTKQILLYIRLHGHHPVRPDPGRPDPARSDPARSDPGRADLCDPDEDRGTSIKDLYPDVRDICSRSVFDFERLNETIEEVSSDEEIDVTSTSPPPRVRKDVESTSALQVLPAADEDRLRFMFIERKCADIGIELRNEDIGHGYSYSAVHAVLLSAAKNYCEELIRNALAEKRKQDCPGDSLSIWNGWSPALSVELAQVWRGAQCGRLRSLSARDVAAAPSQYEHL